MASNPLVSFLSLAVLLSTSITLIAHTLNPPRPWLIYLFKPLTTLFILALALFSHRVLTDSYAGAIAVGLLFSLAGDIFLMLPGNYFMHGLVSFLIGHLWYWIAFFPAALGVELFWPLIPLLGLGGGVLRLLWPSLSKSLKGPVSLYLIVIVGMVALSASRALETPSSGTLSAATGALLFLTSDTFLALNRFRKPFPYAQIAVLTTYFAGQWLIALSIVLGA